MSKTVISVEHLSKRYGLGVIGATTLQRDLNFINYKYQFNL